MKGGIPLSSQIWENRRSPGAKRRGHTQEREVKKTMLKKQADTKAPLPATDTLGRETVVCNGLKVPPAP